MHGFHKHVHTIYFLFDLDLFLNCRSIDILLSIYYVLSQCIGNEIQILYPGTSLISHPFTLLFWPLCLSHPGILLVFWILTVCTQDFVFEHRALYVPFLFGTLSLLMLPSASQILHLADYSCPPILNSNVAFFENSILSIQWILTINFHIHCCLFMSQNWQFWIICVLI